MTGEPELIFANEAFYQAFADRDLAAMDALWARTAPVVCTHPGWPSLVGRAAVMESWSDILGNPEAPKIACRNAQAFRIGEVGIVVCYEKLEEGLLAASNTFVREDGAWRMVNHHASPCARIPGGEREPEARRLQ